MMSENKRTDPDFYELKCHRDARGALIAGEFGVALPFFPKRYFVVCDVIPGENRGQHAHRECKQFLTCVSGSCTVEFDDGKSKRTFRLESPTEGLYAPPMTWVSLSDFSGGAVLLVFASDYYDATDYIRDYGEFTREVKAK